MPKPEDVSIYPEIFVSIDIETTGPVPGLYSMISLGAAAFTAVNGLDSVSTFQANLKELPEADDGSHRDDDTMDWWASHMDAWEAARKEPEEIEAVMNSFRLWIESLGPNVVPVYYPSGYDLPFISYYSQRFLGKVFLTHRAIDLQTLAWSMLGSPFVKNSRQSAYPKEWLVTNKHKHRAVDDAVAQGQMFMRMNTVGNSLIVP